MTVVTTGASLGLFNSSANVLGAAGMLGQGWLGQALQRSYVNAVTGNLVLQAQDEQLSGRGADLFQLRTYNSLGQLNDGDGDGWRWDGERSVVFAAGTNKEGPGVGGSVTRTGSDGHGLADAQTLAAASVGAGGLEVWIGGRHSAHDFTCAIGAIGCHDDLIT